MTNPLDKLTAVIAGLMGKEPSDPDVLKAAVDVVMAMREPSPAMVGAAISEWVGDVDAEITWQAMIDALLTEGG